MMKMIHKRLKRFFGSTSVKKRGVVSEEKADKSFKGCGSPSVFHATMVIFWEFFAWGLMTTPTLSAVSRAFPLYTFLFNGLVQGIKGILSFLCAPLIGALSDAWGRKSFLLLAVFFTCAPIPILLLDSLVYFVAVALSGIFAVTFSVVFSYVADCTSEENRSFSYGLVSATFAASLVISPSLGNFIIEYSAGGERDVILLAAGISILNVAFIIFCVPESLQEAVRKSSWGSSISWEHADPFASLRKIGNSPELLRICVVVFLSYLPEAGQYSCFFLYLKQVVKFTNEGVGFFIAVLCILSVLAQTLLLSFLMQYLKYKRTIIIGLCFQLCQLLIFGLSTDKVIMCMGGVLAAVSSITYPGISALVSRNAEADQQGVALGILTGIRGLCMGLGPAVYGVLFYLFHVDLGEKATPQRMNGSNNDLPIKIDNIIKPLQEDHARLHGAPFLFGAALVFLAIWVAMAIKNDKSPKNHKRDEEKAAVSEKSPHGELHYGEARHRNHSDSEDSLPAN